MGWGSHNTTTKHGQICFPLHFFTSSPDDTKHGIPLRKAPCSGPTHRQFSASPPKPATCNKPSRKASFHALPNARPLPWHHQRDKPRAPTTALNQSSKEPGRILTGSGLGHGPAAWHRLDPPSHSASFISSYFFRSPPPPCSAHPLFLHPSSEQLPTTQALLARYQGQACVPRTALEVTNNSGGRAAPESTFYSSVPAFAKETFSVTTVAEKGKDTHKKLCYHQTTTCVE